MAAVPDAAVSFLLENLKDLVMANADMIAGAKDDVDGLFNELDVLKGFLKKCTEEKCIDDDFFVGFAIEIRKLFYRAEDVIENYIATVSKHKFRGVIDGALHSIDHALELRNICKEIAALRKDAQSLSRSEIENGLKVIMMKKVDSTIKVMDRPRKHVVDDDMVGLKDAMEDVMGYLINGPDNLQTFSIVGMLGLGKTTLARQVFMHPTVEFEFFSRIFVEVSQDFKRKSVLLKLVRSFGKVSAADMNRMDEDELEEEIRSHLDERNYLIVLDDVWDKNAWDQLKDCFPNNNHNRVLITTRHMAVAEHATASSYCKPYMLRFLNHEESKELLQKRVFGKMGTIKADLRAHEKVILDRCDGLSLAIMVIADILKNDREEISWWKNVSKETFNLPKEADYAIRLSFNDLPCRLKPCFLYLGVFREDFEIPLKTLYRLWISEGFVRPDDHAHETSEEQAESYLKLLVDRSLVVVDKRGSNGRIKRIRIHGILREFCKTQAIVEDLFREIKFENESMERSPDDDRRLCINSKVGEYITSKHKQNGKFVRSFLGYEKEDYVLPVKNISEIPKAFRLLRVLDVRSIRFTQFPTELFYTFLLKYIAMCTDMKTIPEKVSNLRYLQTLIFNTTQRSIEIKADIWKMKQLRHLETNASTSLSKTEDALSVNENLQSLTAISPKSCTPEVVEKAQNLKKLGICGELGLFLEYFFTLSKLGCLENLKLFNANTTIPLKSLPSHTSFPHKLIKLTLQNTRLSWEWMATLAKMEKLEVLKLKEQAFLGPYWNTEDTGGFYSLKVLHIGITDLGTWEASKSHFPQLRHLYLRHCSKLGDMPSDLVNISTLKLIDIYCCKPALATSARKLVFAKLQLQVEENNGNNTQLKLLVYPPEQ